MKFSVTRHFLALTLAALTKLLMFSRMPLLILVHLRNPHHYPLYYVGCLFDRFKTTVIGPKALLLQKPLSLPILLVPKLLKAEVNMLSPHRLKIELFKPKFLK